MALWPARRDALGHPASTEYGRLVFLALRKGSPGRQGVHPGDQRTSRPRAGVKPRQFSHTETSERQLRATLESALGGKMTLREQLAHGAIGVRRRRMRVAAAILLLALACCREK